MAEVEATILQEFKDYAYPTNIRLFDNNQSESLRPPDSELIRTLEVSRKMILRMLGSSVNVLNDLPRAATPARGIIIVTKNPPSSNIIHIPAGTLFFTIGGKIFSSVSEVTIQATSESTPLVVQSAVHSVDENISSGQVWFTSVVGVSVRNDSAFSGGQDASDGDALIKEACFFLAKYFLQNRQFYQRTSELAFGDFLSDQEVQKYEMELPAAVYRHVVGLISHARNPKDFIPQVD